MLTLTSTIDEMEYAMAQHEPFECPIVHRFAPGLYIREMTLPAGVLTTSMEHKTAHAFVVSKGKIEVISENEGAVIYEAPYCGITQPGTRRMAYAVEETVWTTFHVTEETDVETIANEILEPRSNPLLGEGQESFEQWRKSLPSPNN